jgi:hypothetical protein
MADACGQMRTVGQTLFLGASVVSVNINLGWGDTASSATIELVEDFQPCSCMANKIQCTDPINPFFSANYEDNHYYNCASDADCYVDELGDAYNPNRTNSDGSANPPKEKNVPGKIYYVWTNAGVVSRYWYQEDPGFFGTGTRVGTDGTLSDTRNNVYNLINVPVFFKFDNLVYTGIIKSWDSNFNNGLNFYKVEIESVSSLLKNSWMIVDGYAGAVFSYAPGTTYGAPRNFTGDGVNSIGTIQSGNIHNVFNVYGYLESLGPYGFGGSNKNDIGIPYSSIIQTLKVLTSSNKASDLYWKSKNMFSPFGRILAKTMQRVDDSSYSSITPNFKNHAFGVIPPTLDANGIARVEFTLDLSEINIPPSDVRLDTQSKVLRISEFLQGLVEKNGQQNYWVNGHSVVNNDGLPFNIIKIKAVSKNQYAPPYSVSTVVNNLQNNGYAVSTNSSGQARNDDAIVRKIIIGGNQQRLYQAKNYRLAFNQNNYIWDPVYRKFIDYRRFDSSEKDKAKVPIGLSTRNPYISLRLLGNYHNIVDSDNFIRSLILGTFFDTVDNIWDDNIVRSLNANCIKIWRNKDFATDPNTGYPIGEGEMNAIAANSTAYSFIGDYETILTNSLSSDLAPLDILPEPKDAATPSGTQTTAPPPPPPSPTPTPAPTGNQYSRFIPLHNDIISPFFGFKYERSYPISPGNSNIFRNIRPVWMDTWTGQITVTFDIVEAPVVSCGAMVSLYNQSSLVGSNTSPFPNNRVGATSAPATVASPGISPSGSVASSSSYSPSLQSYSGVGFTVTETEMRAAAAGFDSYLQYCLAKMGPTKPDLYSMLVNCWRGKGVLLSGGSSLNTTRTGVTAAAGATLASGPNHRIGSASIAGSTGQPSTLKSGQDTKIANIDFSMLMHPGFVADLQIIVNFIKDLADKYYGKQYMVKLPNLVSYRDNQYSGFNIPGFRGGNVFVFSGSGKLFHNYELADGAWEEWGNYIDNDIIVGGPAWSILSDEKGLIPSILGFNVSDKIDYVRKVWCALDSLEKAKKLSELRKQAVSLADNGILDLDRPTSGSLANWTIRVPTYIDTSVGEEPGAGTGEQGSNIQYVLLDGTETDEWLSEHTSLTGQALTEYKKIRDIKQQAAIIRNSMPSALECGAEEAIVETTTLAFPCKPVGCAPGLYQDSSATYCEENVPCPCVPNPEMETNSSEPCTSANNVTTVYVNDNAFLIPSVDFSSFGDDQDSVIVNTPPFNDAFGSGVCGGGKKLYIRAKLDNGNKLAFGNPENLSDPRAIISIGKYIPLSRTSLAYAHEPNLFVMPNVAAEDIAFYRNAFNYIADDQLTKDEYDKLQYLEAKFLTPIIAPNILLNPGSTINVSANHYRIAPKAAQPFFAAVPLKSNKYVYGPWTNYPDLIKNVAFTYTRDPSSIIENLIDNIDIKVESNYTPWEYGGMSFLDKVAIYDLEESTSYQVLQEKGSVKIVGPPIFTVGGHFADTLSNSLSSPYIVVMEGITSNNAYTYNILYLKDIDTSAFGGYPFIQSISLSVGSEGVNTTYNLGTYNPKHGIYNKERTDQLRKISKNIIDLNNQLISSENTRSQTLRQQIDKIVNDTSRFGSQQDTSKYIPETSLFGNSPSELLIGQSNYYLPAIDKTLAGSDAETIMSKGRHETWAGLFMANEVGTELVNDYANKAAMSLDGIFSPISFYPTHNNSTYAISNYYTTKYLISTESEKNTLTCSVCNNKRYINDIYIDYSSDARTPTPVKYPCPACTHSRLSMIKGSGDPKDDMPRVIVDPKNIKPEINFYTLNPIVVSAGEFRNWNSPANKPGNTGVVNDQHSIRVVARGEILPGSEINLDTTRNLDYAKNINPDYEAYDYDASSAHNGSLFPLNQRFFGFRGPMMLHGWGYDKDGYPIPNLYDEPLEIDDRGRYKRFQLDNNGFNDLSKQGLFESTAEERLGDVVTKAYEWKTDKWIKKTGKSKYFSTNWASKPNTWPVGPIDLRWDYDRRVWTGGGQGACGEEQLPPYIVTNSTDTATISEYLNLKPTNSCPYKMIYITLEQDLVRPNNVYYYSNITRGYIDDLEYNTEPLPAGYRRLVYLIDRSGYTAPAGCRLYCRYNPDLGYYEPISKPITITTGVISSGSQARIDLVYMKGRLSNNTPNTVVNFANPLAFNATEGNRGIFSFIDGQWTLTSINSH